jgi:microcystin-dependent protein
VINGALDPAAGTGVLGDFYLNTASNTLFGPKTSGGWGSGVSLVGPAGVQGPQGTIGPQGPAGPQGVPGNIPVGSIQIYAGISAPLGWLLCDGSAISRTTYSTLFSTIGTSFGSGDGSYVFDWHDVNNNGVIDSGELIQRFLTFNLPDFRGRFLIGRDNMGGVASNNVPNANYVGATGGNNSFTITPDNLPPLSIVTSLTYGDVGCVSCVPRPNAATSSVTQNVGISTPILTIPKYSTIDYIIKY